MRRRLTKLQVVSKEDKELFKRCVKRLDEETNFRKLREYKHHIHTTTYEHSIAAAYISVYICRTIGFKCDIEKLIYAALLHDYYLYDCHEGSIKFHFIKHPKISLENAKRDWKLNKVQEDIIRRHMFPCTLIPPIYKESILVNIVDKICALYELIIPRPYQKTLIPFVMH